MALKSPPQTKRMFIAFGIFMVLVTAMSILFQANFFTSARLKHLADFEIPTQLEKLTQEADLLLQLRNGVLIRLATNNRIAQHLLEQVGVVRQGIRQ